MLKDSFLLGRCFSLLEQIRAYLIRKEEIELLELVESQYQDILKDIKEIKDASHG